MKKVIDIIKKIRIATIYIICISITIFLIKILNVDIYYIKFEKYFLILVPIIATIAIFVMNFHTGKILNKPFSFYYVKLWKNIYILITPLCIQFLLFVISYNFIIEEYLLIFNVIFYSYLVLTVFVDIFKWNKFQYLPKYNKGYIDAIISLPFTDVQDDRMFFEFFEIINVVTDEYDYICNKRLNRLNQVRKINDNIELDNFTYKLLQLNILENKSFNIKLNNDYDFYSVFFKKCDSTFLSQLLLTNGFKYDKNNEEETFNIVFNYFSDKIYFYEEFKFFIQDVVQKRSDISPPYLISNMYIAMYRNKHFKILKQAYDDVFIDNIYEVLAMESIYLTHKQLRKIGVKTEGCFLDKAENLRVDNKINLKLLDTNNLQENKFFDELTILEETFNLVSTGVKRIYYGSYSLEILYSDIILKYIENKYEELNNSLLQITDYANNTSKLINDVEFFLNVAYKLSQYKKQKEERDELETEVCLILTSYKEQIITEREIYNIPYLINNYRVINGLICENFRKQVTYELRKIGAYDIPILSEVFNDKCDDKISIIKKFYKTYECQLKENNEINGDFIQFESNDKLIGSMHISKVEVFKIFINVIFEDTKDIKEKEKFFKLFKENKYFNIAMASFYVYEFEKYVEYVNIDNKSFLLEVNKILKYMFKYKDGDGLYKYTDKLGEENIISVENYLVKFNYLFQNLRLGEDLNLNFLKCVSFMEEMGMHYTINNFDKATADSVRLSSKYFLGSMTEPIDFIKNLFSDAYYNDDYNLLNCFTLSYVFDFIIEYNNRSREDNDKPTLNIEYIEIIKSIIIKIGRDNVKNNKYCVEHISEYKVIVQLIKRFVSFPEISDTFYNSVLKYIDSYLLKFDE